MKKVALKKHLKVRTSVTFHRTKTLKRARTPKYPRLSAPPADKLDHYQVPIERMSRHVELEGWPVSLGSTSFAASTETADAVKGEAVGIT